MSHITRNALRKNQLAIVEINGKPTKVILRSPLGIVNEDAREEFWLVFTPNGLSRHWVKRSNIVEVRHDPGEMYQDYSTNRDHRLYTYVR